MKENDNWERLDMYWVEEPNKTPVAELSNSQLLENLAYAERRYEYLYCRELRRLEQIQAKAIIKNLEEFKSAQSKYFQVKSMEPKNWFKSWDVYKEILNEVERRNITLTELPFETPAKMLCFG